MAIKDANKDLAGGKNTVNNLTPSMRAALDKAATTNARAAQTANDISFKAQEMQYNYNSQLQAAQIAAQWAMMNQANAYSANEAAIGRAENQRMWEQTANYNAQQQARSEEYNATQAAINRNWQEKMSSTAIQRQMADLKAAGLNPILAANYMGANIGSGASASISPSSVGSISAQTASGHMGNAASASVGSFTGILENTSNTLALFGAIMSGLETLLDANNVDKDDAEAVGDAIGGAVVNTTLKFIKGLVKEDPVLSDKTYEWLKNHNMEWLHNSYWKGKNSGAGHRR